MQSSEQITELMVAFHKAQAEMENPAFDKLNPHFKTHYATLVSVRKAVLPPLLQNGISVIQMMGNNEKGDMACTTRLTHTSGQWIQSTFSIPADRMTGQGFASAATYARRIAAQALCFVVGDADNDGEEGEARKKRNSGSPTAQNKEAFDNLPDAMKSKLVDFSTPVKDAVAAGKIALAFEKYEQYKEDLNDTQQTAFWSLFSAPERRAIKNHGESLKEKA